MRAFVAFGTKFSSNGHTWIAGPERRMSCGTAFEQIVQVWKSKTTWKTITCKYDIRSQKLVWEVERYSTAQTRSGAAALAASETREALDGMVDHLARYGDEIEKRYSKMIHKKKGHVNVLFPEGGKDGKTTKA